MTTTTPLRVDEIPMIRRDEVAHLATTENRRTADLLVSLAEADWTRPTDCTAWDVRALAAHVLGGMEAFASFREFVHQMRAGKKAAGHGPFIDGMTAVQVRERAHLSNDELLARVGEVGPKVARARSRVPGLVRRFPMKQDLNDGTVETWRMGYLVDVILTRDTWMHRVDIARAVGREMMLTADHDGRIVADAVAEWARRHGQPFNLILEGPAGGTFVNQHGGEPISMDAVQFCRTISGRAPAPGLLSQEVPF